MIYAIDDDDTGVLVDRCKWVRVVDTTMGPNRGRVTLHDKKDCGRVDCPNSSAYRSGSKPGFLWMPWVLESSVFDYFAMVLQEESKIVSSEIARLLADVYVLDWLVHLVLPLSATPPSNVSRKGRCLAKKAEMIVLLLAKVLWRDPDRYVYVTARNRFGWKTVWHMLTTGEHTAVRKDEARLARVRLDITVDAHSNSEYGTTSRNQDPCVVGIVEGVEGPIA
ncbi:hypothetical protein F5I97DRAFT_1831583 [Phlebopus sp. FC_14]|nr:hypothetical protein F5I97DRAFT_1831583 [Phlebopus sp. FC_14]